MDGGAQGEALIWLELNDREINRGYTAFFAETLHRTSRESDSQTCWETDNRSLWEGKDEVSLSQWVVGNPDEPKFCVSGELFAVARL